MRICIFGAGAVGSHFAVRLALAAGHQVSCVMRGPHLRSGEGERPDARCASAAPSFRPGSPHPTIRRHLRPQDFVISTLKAAALGSLATGLQPLLADDTAVVFAQNGIPWWVRSRPRPGSARRRPTSAFLGPGGTLRAAVSPRRIIGGVIFSSNTRWSRPAWSPIFRPSATCFWSRRMRRPLPAPADRQAARRARCRRSRRRRRCKDPRDDLVQAPDQRICRCRCCASLTGQTARGAGEGTIPRCANVIPRLLDEANSIGQSVLPEGQARHPHRARRPTTSRRSCRTTNSAARWRSTCWSRRRPPSRGRRSLSTPMLDLLAALAIRQARDKRTLSSVGGVQSCLEPRAPAPLPLAGEVGSHRKMRGRVGALSASDAFVFYRGAATPVGSPSLRGRGAHLLLDSEKCFNPLRIRVNTET